MYINMHLDDIIQYDHLMKEEPLEALEQELMD